MFVGTTSPGWLRSQGPDCSYCRNNFSHVGPPAAIAAVGGLAEVAAKALLPPTAVSALQAELLELGAAHVTEVTEHDWPHLQSWALLKPCQQRRLLKIVGECS